MQGKTKTKETKVQVGRVDSFFSEREVRTATDVEIKKIETKIKKIACSAAPVVADISSGYDRHHLRLKRIKRVDRYRLTPGRTTIDG